MAQQLLGKEVAAALKDGLQAPVTALAERGIVPCLAIVRVGERGDDIAYERSAMKRMDAVGVKVKNVVLSEDVTQDALEDAFRAVNEDANVHGIMIFQPLPKHLSAEPLVHMINPLKDVDGISPVNTAKVFAGDPSGVAPCTPEACMEILAHYGVDVTGKRVAVVGRSMVVGRPLSMLLLKENATVTICHTRTKDLADRLKEADIVIAAAGKAKMITAEMVRPETVVIDVGINVDENGKLVGDVDYDNVEPIVSAITPVPGGVGGVTTILLAQHVVEAAKGLNEA